MHCTIICPNLEGRLPTLDGTCKPVSRSNGQRSGSPGPLMLTHIMCHIFWMARPTNFKLGIWMEDDDLNQPQAPWPPRSKLKVARSRDQSAMLAQWPVNRKRIVVVSPKFALGTKYQDAYDRQSRWPPRSKVKVVSSHHLYFSSLPLLNSGNKMLTCVLRGWLGHSAEPGGHTSCLKIENHLSVKCVIKQENPFVLKYCC